MRTTWWLLGLARRRPVELLVAGLSIAIAMAFVASLGAFVTQSRSALTVRAATSVPVDWQVQVTPQGNLTDVEKKIRDVPGLRATETVSYAKVEGFTSVGASGKRRTGAAYVVSIPDGYTKTFPKEIRPLLGSNSGVRLLQQTAANLASSPGETFTVRAPGSHRSLTVDGVVEMPAEDSFFQVVGLPAGAGVSAPPDNVVLVPSAMFDGLVGSSDVIQQVHVKLAHDTLPPDPHSATLLVDARSNNLQASLTGGALIGDNLGTTLTAAEGDARYANLLFLLLGLPGLALAAVVAVLVVSLRSDRRRREIGLLRLRGAGPRAIVRIVFGEAVATAAVGAALGFPLAWLAVRLALPADAALTWGWSIAALLGGLALATVTQLAPLWSHLVGGSRTTVAEQTVRAPQTQNPWPLRAGLDVLLLVGAAVAFALTARSGYQVVLAPEGIPSTQVNFGALLGPALAWPGLALLVWRITAFVTSRRTGRWSRGGRGTAPELEAAALRHRRRGVARGAAGLAVAIGLAFSTAIFTATYDQQSSVDVALTVGSDVSVVEPPGATVGPGGAADFRDAAGVKAVEPMQHRFAYVGPDLQDIYGVNASTFGDVAPLQDAYVPNSTISAALSQLDNTPDGVLLSAETLHDYQLHPGDTVKLRLQTGPDKTYRPVTFHVVGQVAEWPTAPKDSFIVANAAYLTQQTGSDAVGTFLISSDTPATTAASVRALPSAKGAQVQDVKSARSSVTTASGLAATDLSGLSRLELGFGIVLALACSGLALVGGIVERRRALVLLAAFGASARQRGRFLSTEARSMVLAGIAGGVVVGGVIAYLLVKVLNGIFDPPPSSPSIPWLYLAGLVTLVGGVTVAVVAVVGRLAARAGPTQLRDL